MTLTSYFKYIAILSLLIFSHIKSNNPQVSISYNDIAIDKALQKIVTDYEVPIIYPSKIANQYVSIDCYDCDLETVLNIILSKIDYDWKKIGNQYTIFEIDAVKFNVTGRVYDKKSNETIPYANIYIPHLNIGTASDNEGFFSLSNIESKICTLLVSYIGYETHKQVVKRLKNENIFLNIFLNQKVLKSKNIFIRGVAREFLSIAKDPGKISFSPRHVSTLPTIGEIDIFRSLQLLPGINAGLGGNAELYIRGGRPEQNLILIDGMSLYQDTHMFGFLSSAQAASIKDVQVYKGVYPARYGGKISGLLEITNKTGSNYGTKAKVFTNFTTNSAQLEMPISSNGSFILTGRICNDIVPTKLYSSIKDFIIGDDNFNLISLSANPNQSSSYAPKFNFQDFSAVATYMINPMNNVSFTLIHGEDNIDEKREFYGFEDILRYGSSKIEEDTDLSNSGGIVKWTYNANPKWNIKFSYANTTYSSKHYSKLYDISSPIDELAQSIQERNTFNDESINIYQNIRMIKNHMIQFGYNRSDYNINLNNIRSLSEVSEKNNASQQSLLHSTFFEDIWTPNKKLRLVLGLRNTFFSEKKMNYLEPRLFGTYKISPSLTIEGAAGKNNQFIHQFNNSFGTRSSNSTWIISGKRVPIVRSYNSQIGMHLKNHFSEVSFSLYTRKSEGHFNFEEYLSPMNILSDDSDINSDYLLYNEGREKSDGIELLVRRKNKSINGWISYHYNKTNYSFNNINNGKFYKADHDFTHELKTVLITSILDWNLTASWSYSSGRSFTNEDYINITTDFKVDIVQGKKNTLRLPPSHHLDISISKDFNLKYFNINSGLSIYNVYNRKNISHKRYNPFSSGRIISNVMMLGITPTIFFEINI